MAMVGKRIETPGGDAPVERAVGGGPLDGLRSNAARPRMEGMVVIKSPLHAGPDQQGRARACAQNSMPAQEKVEKSGFVCRPGGS